MEFINSEVKVLGEKQAVLNNVSELNSALLNDIFEHLKSKDIASSKDVKKILPAGLILDVSDFILELTGNKNNTQIVPFRLKNNQVENTRSLEVYLPHILSTLDKDKKPTPATTVAMMGIAVPAVVFACRFAKDENLTSDIKKSMRYNGAGMLSHESKTVFRWCGLTVDNYGLTTAIDSELMKIAKKHTNAIKAISKLKMSTSWRKPLTTRINDDGIKVLVNGDGSDGKPAPASKTVELFCSIQCPTVVKAKAKHTYSRVGMAYAGACGECGVFYNLEAVKTPPAKLLEFQKTEQMTVEQVATDMVNEILPKTETKKPKKSTKKVATK